MSRAILTSVASHCFSHFAAPRNVGTQRERRPRPGIGLLPLVLSLIVIAPASAGTIKMDLKAFTVFGNPTTGQNHVLVTYETANGWGIDYLDPETAKAPLTTAQVLASNNETPYNNFFNVLNTKFGTFNGWTITGDSRTFSNNSLLIHTYDAEAGANFVGAQIDVEYKPSTAQGSTDPTANMHWIQVISNNHALNQPHGTLANTVDIRVTNTQNPYYDNGFAADSRNFFDEPARDDPENDHFWTAALFLVSGPNAAGTPANPATITVYNDSGIFWGWKNQFFPNVDFQEFVADVRNQIEPNLPVDQLAEFDAELNAVPEPATISLVTSAVLCLVVVAASHRLGKKAAAPATS